MYMTFKNTTEKKRMTYIFAGFYSSAAILLILIFTIFWENNSTNSGVSGDQELTQIDNVLRDHLNGLQYLDKKFASLLIDSGIKADFDTTFNKARKAELAFSSAIDSIGRSAVSAKNMGKLNQIIFAYKTALENRKAMDDMQQGITLGSKQIRNDEQTLLRFKNDGLKKDSSITELNGQIKSKPADRYAVSFPSSDYKLLRNENEYLKSELKLMEIKFAEQRNHKLRLNEEMEEYANLQVTDQAKSSVNRKAERGHAKPVTGGTTKQQ